MTQFSSIDGEHGKVTKLCGRPDLRHVDARDPEMGLVGWEEPGTFWLWAWPELLDWPRKITWLFSPPTGNYTWPGDVWGVDSSGQLVVVETKNSLARRDPFEDFVPFNERFSCGKWEITVEQIIAKWERHLKAERKFLLQYSDVLRDGSGERCRSAGVVPTSCKRLATWRWRELYLENIGPIVASGVYETSVRIGLELWANGEQKCPHYIALFTVLEGKRPRFSRNGRANYEVLVQKTPTGHVHAYATECFEISDSKVRIECWRLNPPELK